MSTPLAIALVALVLAIFAALWLSITILLGVLAGWSGLARRFPDRDETPRIQLRAQSGAMGMGVQLHGVLTLAACPSGLRVTISRGLAPFSKPFFVPWSEIQAKPKRALLADLTRLGFGMPEAGALTVSKRIWDRLSSTDAQPRATDP